MQAYKRFTCAEDLQQLVKRFFHQLLTFSAGVPEAPATPLAAP